MRALSGKWRSLSDTCTELRELQDQVRAWTAGAAQARPAR
jgi:hypothetical protein